MQHLATHLFVVDRYGDGDQLGHDLWSGGDRHCQARTRAADRLQALVQGRVSRQQRSGCRIAPSRQAIERAHVGGRH